MVRGLLFIAALIVSGLVLSGCGPGCGEHLVDVKVDPEELAAALEDDWVDMRECEQLCANMPYDEILGCERVADEPNTIECEFNNICGVG